MTQVDIFIKHRWHGSLRGSGEAVAVIVCTDRQGTEHLKIITTKVKDSTKERLQLQAVTKALHVLKTPCSVGIYIDNAFIRSTIENGWLKQWQRSGWRNKQGKEVKNADVWMILCPILKRHKVEIMAYIGRYEQEMEEALKGKIE